MANVPAVLILGGASINGGDPGLNGHISAAGAAELLTARPGDVLRVVPDNPVTGASTAASLGWYPWFDGPAGDALYQIAGATSTTVTATGSPGWTVNQHVGKLVTNVHQLGFGFKNRQYILSNTASQLTVASWPGGTPAAPETFFIGDGRWRDYHPVAGWVTPTELLTAISTRGGSTWYADGLGIGPDAGLLRQLLDHVFTAAPFFQVAKFATATPTHSAFDSTTGSVKSALQAQIARQAAAWTLLANGHALVYDYVILDLSQSDVLSWVATPTNALVYKTKLEQTIAWLRSAAALNNASAKIVLVNHDRQINNVTAPFGTAYANAQHRAVAAADANVYVSSMQGLPLWLPTNQPANTNRGFYEASVYWHDMPRRLRQTFELIALGNAAEFDGAVPVYIMFGDSIFVGEITETYLTNLESPTLTPTPRDARQGVFNKDTGEAEPYDVGDNSNTCGTVSASAAEECSLLVELMNRHPVTGCIIVKRAVSGSSLIANAAAYTGTFGGRWSAEYAENQDRLAEDWSELLSYVNGVLGKQVDLKAMFVSLGTNDATVTGGGAQFAAALLAEVAGFRARFSTRTSGAATPVIWRRPQLAATSVIYAECVAVRAALADRAANDPRFLDVDFDDLERSDGVHETPDAAIEGGVRLARALDLVAI